MFVHGSIGKVPPPLSAVRHTSEYSTGQPPSNIKSMIPQRPPIEKMRNPLLREVDDELRKLKSQFDMIKNDQYVPKSSNTAESNEPHFFSTNSAISNTLKGLVNFPSTLSKPTSSNPGLLSNTNSNANSQPNLETKAIGAQIYGQNKKITQSFQTKKDNFMLMHLPEPGRILNNPEQPYKPINLTSSDKLPSYKPFTSYLTEQMAESKLQQPQSNANNIDRKQTIPDRSQKASNAHQFKPQNTTFPIQSESLVPEATKDTKNNTPPLLPPYRSYTSDQYKSNSVDISKYITKKNETGKAQLAKKQVDIELNNVQSVHIEGPKAQLFKLELDRSSNDNYLKDLNNSSPIQQIKSPQTRTELSKPECLPSSNPNTQREENVSSPRHNQSKLNQQDTRKPTIQSLTRQNLHRLPDNSKLERGRDVQHNLPTVQNPSRLSPRNDIQRYDIFQSERVRYQDPNPYVSPEARRTAEMKDKVVELSPNQRQRDQSIKKYEAKKIADLEERIGTLIKSNDSLNKQNAQLKQQQLRNTDKIKADYQALQASAKQSNQKYKQLNILYQEAQMIIGKRDQSIKDFEMEVKRLKETIEADKSEGGFNMALKAQIEENQRLKDRFTEKDEEITELRQKNKTIRMQSDSFKNEIEIERLKRMTEMKNMQINYDIEIQKLTNEIESMRKVMNSLDQKFKYIMKQDRKKDEFLVNYLKGKTHDPNDKELIMNFFKQYEEAPKLTISELLRQEYRMQEQLKKEVQILKAQLTIGYPAYQAYN